MKRLLPIALLVVACGQGGETPAPAEPDAARPADAAAALDAPGPDLALQADADGDGPPSGALCRLTAPPGVDPFNYGFKGALIEARTEAVVAARTPTGLSLSVNRLGHVDFEWPSALPDFKVSDPVFVERICDSMTDECWEVVSGPRAVAAVVTNRNFSAQPPPPLLGHTFGWVACSLWNELYFPENCKNPPPGRWISMYDAVVSRGNDQVTVPLSGSATLGAWRFENLQATVVPQVDGSEPPVNGSQPCAQTGAAVMVMTASGPP